MQALVAFTVYYSLTLTLPLSGGTDDVMVILPPLIIQSNLYPRVRLCVCVRFPLQDISLNCLPS